MMFLGLNKNYAFREPENELRDKTDLTVKQNGTSITFPSQELRRRIVRAQKLKVRVVMIRRFADLFGSPGRKQSSVMSTKYLPS